ncbi:MAG: ketoacyl-ACP synthase III [Planctomycetota bacterium]
MSTFLRGIGYKLPTRIETNEDLVEGFPGWTSEKIVSKTGIYSRHVLSEGETPGDLAFELCKPLIEHHQIDPSEIDLVLFCTQSPDYHLPSTACILQARLGLHTRCGALDFNLGCSGFTYGLWLAQGMVESGQCRNVLLVTADAYSRYCRNADISVRCLFGDAAGAVIIGRKEQGALARILRSNVGTDGNGAEHLIVPQGCARELSLYGVLSSDPCLSMNGPEVFAFTLRTVHKSICDLLDSLGWSMESVDKFLLHQANAFMLQKLRNSMGLDESRLPIDLADLGNTVSATLPILIHRCWSKGLLTSGRKYILSGFGVGLSWANTAIEWIEQ